jgi:hypothetical protein
VVVTLDTKSCGTHRVVAAPCGMLFPTELTARPKTDMTVAP